MLLFDSLFINICSYSHRPACACVCIGRCGSFRIRSCSFGTLRLISFRDFMQRNKQPSGGLCRLSRPARFTFGRSRCFCTDTFNGIPRVYGSFRARAGLGGARTAAGARPRSALVVRVAGNGRSGLGHEGARAPRTAPRHGAGAGSGLGYRVGGRSHRVGGDGGAGKPRHGSRVPAELRRGRGGVCRRASGPPPSGLAL